MLDQEHASHGALPSTVHYPSGWSADGAGDEAHTAGALWRLRNAPSDADFMRYVEAGLAQVDDGRTTYAGLTGIAFVRIVTADRAIPSVRAPRA